MIHANIITKNLKFIVFFLILLSSISLPHKVLAEESNASKCEKWWRDVNHTSVVFIDHNASVYICQKKGWLNWDVQWTHYKNLPCNSPKQYDVAGKTRYFYDKAQAQTFAVGHCVTPTPTLTPVPTSPPITLPPTQPTCGNNAKSNRDWIDAANTEVCQKDNDYGHVWRQCKAGYQPKLVSGGYVCTKIVNNTPTPTPANCASKGAGAWCANRDGDGACPVGYAKIPNTECDANGGTQICCVPPSDSGPHCNWCAAPGENVPSGLQHKPEWDNMCGKDMYGRQKLCYVSSGTGSGGGGGRNCRQVERYRCVDQNNLMVGGNRVSACGSGTCPSGTRKIMEHACHTECESDNGGNDGGHGGGGNPNPTDTPTPTHRTPTEADFTTWLDTFVNYGRSTNADWTGDGRVDLNDYFTIYQAFQSS